MATQLKKTVKPSGGDYTSLEACMNANEQNLVTADKYFDVEIDGDWSGGADTTAVTIHNYTADATRYINIYTTGDARHDGKRYGSKSTAYKLEVTDARCLYKTGSAFYYVFVTGLQLKRIYSSSGGDIINFEGGGGNRIIGNIIDGGGDTHIPGIGGVGEVTYGSIVARNIITGCNSEFNGAIRTGTSVSVIAYNTIYKNNGSYAPGLRTTAICYGNAVFDNYYNFYSGEAGDTTYSGYNITNSASGAAGSNNIYNISSSNEFVSTSAGSEDLHLKSGATSIDAIASPAYTGSPYTPDIDGVSVTGNWDIGADEYVSAVVATIKRRMLMGVGI